MDSFKARADQAIYQAKEDGRNRVQIALAAKKSVAFCLMVQGLRRMKAETGMHDASSARRNSQVAQALPGARLGPCQSVTSPVRTAVCNTGRERSLRHERQPAVF